MSSFPKGTILSNLSTFPRGGKLNNRDQPERLVKVLIKNGGSYDSALIYSDKCSNLLPEEQNSQIGAFFRSLSTFLVAWNGFLLFFNGCFASRD